jgi:hypothetical protein
MPVAVSRKLEFFVRSEGIEADIKLYPLVLTAQQVRSYRLPRTPIKESERRKESFEQRHGSGATELDALEALQPGELRRVLRRNIEAYYDTGLTNEVNRIQDRLEGDLRQVRQSVLDQHETEIEEVKDLLTAMQRDFEPRLQDYKQRLQALWYDLNNEMQEQMPDINQYPLPEGKEAEEIGEPLYDSARDYIDQIDAYKAFQGK